MGTVKLQRMACNPEYAYPDRSQCHSIQACKLLLQVGTISANGDTEIGQLIARAMERVGKEGVITVAVIIALIYRQASSSIKLLRIQW